MLGKIRYFLFIVIIAISIVIMIPICLLRPFSTRNNTTIFKILSFLCKYIVRMEVHIEGEDHIRNNYPCVLIGNHQHNYDVLAVHRLFIDKTVILGKFELGLIPVFGQIYTLCGNILVKRGNRKKAMKSMQALEKRVIDKKLAVLVFPEGHRNMSDDLMPFKKGAFYTAVRTQSPLIPFAISQFAKRPEMNSLKKVDIYCKVYEPMTTIGLKNSDIPELITKSREVISTGIKEMNQKYSH